MTSATNGTGTITLLEHLSSPLVFSEIRVTRSLVLCVCFADRCLSFCTFSFGDCVVCSLRILITLLVSSNSLLQHAPRQIIMFINSTIPFFTLEGAVGMGLMGERWVWHVYLQTDYSYICRSLFSFFPVYIEKISLFFAWIDDNNMYFNISGKKGEGHILMHNNWMWLLARVKVLMFTMLCNNIDYETM